MHSRPHIISLGQTDKIRTSKGPLIVVGMSSQTRENHTLDFHQFQSLKKDTNELRNQLFKYLEQEDKSSCDYSEYLSNRLKQLCETDRDLHGFVVCHFQEIGYACIAHHETLCELGIETYSALFHLVSLTDLQAHEYQPTDYTALENFVNQYQSSMMSIISEHSVTLRRMIKIHCDCLERLVTDMWGLTKRLLLGGYLDEHINVLVDLVEENRQKLKDIRERYSYCLNNQKITRFSSLQKSIANFNSIKISLLSFHRETKDYLAQVYCTKLDGLTKAHYKTIQRYKFRASPWLQLSDPELSAQNTRGSIESPSSNSADRSFKYPLKVSFEPISTPQSNCEETPERILVHSNIINPQTVRSVPTLQDESLISEYKIPKIKHRTSKEREECNPVSEYQEAIKYQESIIQGSRPQQFASNPRIDSSTSKMTSANRGTWSVAIGYPKTSAPEPADQNPNDFFNSSISRGKLRVSRLTNESSSMKDINRPYGHKMSSITRDGTVRYVNKSSIDQTFPNLIPQDNSSTQSMGLGVFTDPDNSSLNFHYPTNSMDLSVSNAGDNSFRNYQEYPSAAFERGHFENGKSAFRSIVKGAYENSEASTPNQILQSCDRRMRRYFGNMLCKPFGKNHLYDSVNANNSSIIKGSTVANRKTETLRRHETYSVMGDDTLPSQSMSSSSQGMTFGALEYSNRSISVHASRIKNNDNGNSFPRVLTHISGYSDKFITVLDSHDQRNCKESFTSRTAPEISKANDVSCLETILKNEAELLALRWYNKDPIEPNFQVCTTGTRTSILSPAKDLSSLSENSMTVPLYKNNTDNRECVIQDIESKDIKRHKLAIGDQDSQYSITSMSPALTNIWQTSFNNREVRASGNDSHNSKNEKALTAFSSESGFLLSPLQPGLKKLDSILTSTKNSNFGAVRFPEKSNSEPLVLIPNDVSLRSFSTTKIELSRNSVKSSSATVFPDPIDSMESSITNISDTLSTKTVANSFKVDPQKSEKYNLLTMQSSEVGSFNIADILKDKCQLQNSTKAKSFSLKRKRSRNIKLTKALSLKQIVPRPVCTAGLSEQTAGSFSMRYQSPRPTVPIIIKSSNIIVPPMQSTSPAVSLTPTQTTFVPVFIQSSGGKVTSVQTVSPALTGITEPIWSVPLFFKRSNGTDQFNHNSGTYHLYNSQVNYSSSNPSQ